MGEVFAGRYELADPIGRGGVGAVWRAWDHRRRRYVAAKVLQQSDAHTLLRFVREQALRIDHPNVLAPASWAADDDKVLFTMDLVAGGSLAHLVADYGPLPPEFVCVLLDQLLAGVTAVHAEGVVHRDIKPANILLEATGTGLPHLRLSDFGIAMRKGEPRLTEADYVVGTPGWFAPEQALGAEPDFPADLFAVGLVALYLLEGAKPDAQALIEHFAERGTPSAPRGVPGPLWGVLAGLLQPDPEARFRTATGARKALLAAAELLPEPGPDDELIEVFDQLGPLPPGFSPDGPAVRGRRARPLNAAGGPVRPQASDDLREASTSAPTTPAAPTAPVMPAAPLVPPALVVPPPPVPPPLPHQPAPLHSVPKPNPSPEPEPEPEPEPDSAPALRSSSGSGSGSDSRFGSDSTSGQPLMSETGSFHLPPPSPRDEPLPPPPPPVPPMPVLSPSVGAPLSAAEPAPELKPEPAGTGFRPLDPTTPPPHTETFHDRSPQPAPAVTTVVPDEEGRHSLYTARAQEVPQLQPEPLQPRPRPPHQPRPRPHPQPQEHQDAPQRRPGPPPAVAIPVLLVAALCFAVGIWALTQA
ncbi:serine/threonine-protein kinase [Streptomyces sp. NPDC059524]|uniref:serine/threonine-protein kinase n=1 Tax=Streptomyces sp. NPDC059524 TaxID=3346856 RepID=UPI00367C11B0